MKTERKKLIRDITLAAFFIFIGLSVFIVFSLGRAEGDEVSVTVGEGESVIYSLHIDGEYSLNGGTNTLVISGGKAYMKEANCPDKTCVRSRAISKEGERIVCLPNRIYVVVK